MHDVFVDVGSGAGGEECNEPKQADAINHVVKTGSKFIDASFLRNHPKLPFW